MNEQSNNPFVSWRAQHPSNTLDAETERGVQQWIRVNRELYALLDVADDVIEPWIERKRGAKTPNLVEFIAGYGYSRTVTGDWNALPIDIPEAELTEWEENSGLVSTMETLHDYQAGIAGTVPQILFARQDDAIQLIFTQLKKLYDELALLVKKPVADFAPTQWDDEALGDEAIGREIETLDRIFDIYEELWCFEQGIEELRMLMITEDDKEFHLPNKSFYEALVSIDSQKLLSVLESAEPKLKEILRSWARTTMESTGKPYHRPYDGNAPEAFWWRHRPRQQQGRSSSR